MTGIKVGDKVRLTGKDWVRMYGLGLGTVVTVESIDNSGLIWANGHAGSVGNRNGLYSASNPETSGDFSCELVLVKPFEDTVREFSTTTAVSPEQAKEIYDLGSEIGIAESSSFEQSVNRITGDIANLLILKNKAYGDSALNPVRVFSKASRMEQLFIRLDDKLSRVQRGHEYPGDDTIRDIIGYCTLILIAREGE